MSSNEAFVISVVAGGRERKFQLQTKKDEVLHKSIITKEKADLTHGIVAELPESVELKDSKGITYSTKSCVVLRWQYGTSPQTFEEDFYIVDSCELDALLRRDISKGQLSDEEARCLPLLWGSKTQDQSSTQAAAVSQAEKLSKELKDKDKVNDWNQPPPKKKGK